MSPLTEAKKGACLPVQYHIYSTRETLQSGSPYKDHRGAE